MTLWAWHAATLSVEAEARAQFEFTTERMQSAINNRLHGYEQMLQGAVGLFAAAQDVDRLAWRRYVANLQLKEKYPGVQAIGVGRYIRHHEKRFLIEAMRRDGFPDYRIHPEGDRDEYTPIVFMEPFEGRNLRAFGHDPYANPERRLSLQTARDTGRPAATGKVTLVQETDRDVQNGFLIYFPMYRPGMPADTVEQRRQAFYGFIGTAFRMNSFMADVLGEHASQAIGLEIFDGPTETPDNSLYNTASSMYSALNKFYRPRFARSVNFEFNGRQWLMHFMTLPGFDRSRFFYAPYLVLAGGLAFTLLMTALVFMLQTRANAIRKTVRKQTAELAEKNSALFAEKERAMVTLRSIADAVITTDTQGVITYMNPVAEQLTEWHASEAHGLLLSTVARIVDAATGQSLASTVDRVLKGAAVTGTRDDAVLVSRSGREHAIAQSVAPLRNRAGGITGLVFVFHDVTESRRLTAQMTHLALHDALTGLPNRTLLQERLSQILTRADRNGAKAALLFLDLDRFKNVNDSLGHAVGDKLLQAVAGRLQGCVRAGDTVCRQGGDEFLILLSEISSATDVIGIAEKLREAMLEPYCIDDQELIVTVSIGICICPDDGRNVEAIVKSADAAMYVAKESGRDNFQFFSSELDQRTSQKLALERSLRRAVERRELLLHFQPQVDIRSGEIIGVEALLRWQHPELGLVSPDKFIPIAEECGAIVPIGEWVLYEACRQNRLWQDRGLRHIPVAVNLSAVQLRRKDFLQVVERTLEQTGLAPEYLELEITESVIMDEADSIISLLNALRRMNLRMSVDDFGTGYSSLSYLKRFPIDRLKIDKTFVRDITVDPDDAAIARAIIGMGQSLRLRIIAEGVETEEQLEFLREHGCEELQGFYFSPPVDAAQFETLLVKTAGKTPIRAVPGEGRRVT